MNKMPDSLLAGDDSAPVTVYNENGRSPILIVAEVLTDECPSLDLVDRSQVVECKPKPFPAQFSPLAIQQHVHADHRSRNSAAPSASRHPASRRFRQPEPRRNPAGAFRLGLFLGQRGNAALYLERCRTSSRPHTERQRRLERLALHSRADRPIDGDASQHNSHVSDRPRA